MTELDEMRKMGEQIKNISQDLDLKIRNLRNKELISVNQSYMLEDVNRAIEGLSTVIWFYEKD